MSDVSVAWAIVSDNTARILSEHIFDDERTAAARKDELNRKSPRYQRRVVRVEIKPTARPPRLRRR